MQRQHQQLHTHEKILRYELSQKRKMLTELKEELQYCRDKWEQAREKNTSTEEQWKQLRSEFALRKVTTVDDLNNSAESGYSDEREGSSDDESTYETNKIAILAEKNSSDTDNDETSHGSDTEDLLETAFSKACSSSALQQPNLKLSEVYVLNSDMPLTSNPNDTENMTNISCDNKVDFDFSECSTLHSTENETDSPVQIEKIIESSQNIVENISSSQDEVQKSIEETPNINEEIGHNTQADAETSSQYIEVQNSNVETTNEIENGSSQNDDTIEDQSIESEETSQDDETMVPSTSQSSGVQRTSEEILSKREERLRRLEEQCKLLVTKVTNTTSRGAEISSRLTTLHEQYGSTSENTTQNQENISLNEENTDNDETTQTEENI